VNEPMLLKTIPRVLLILAGVYFGFLGYRLFLLGLKAGKNGGEPASKIPGGRGSVGAGMFLIVVAGAIVSGVSLTGGSALPGSWSRSVPATRATDRAELMRQIETLRQADKQYQRVIADLRVQVGAAKTNEGLSAAAVSQMEQSLNAATENVDFNELYTQMMELSDLATTLQSENEALRAENASLRGESPTPRSEAAPQ
jgi:hypothetical protein